MHTELALDKNREMYLRIDELNTQVCLAISDGLFAYEEVLTPAYTAQILSFINQVAQWYPNAVEAVQGRARQIYQCEANAGGIRLTNIFVLFEQAASPVFGLQFRVEFDIEHACGLKISGSDYQILETGAGDVAFC